ATDTSVAEGTTAVETVSATDADAGDSKTYSISGTDASFFTIGATSGVLTFTTAPDYENPSDSDANNVYVLNVTVTDGASHTDTKTINVTVTDVKDNSPVLTATDTSVAEGTTAVETVSATDADAGD
ncbi:cadherin repeat domain-containing protein, partial [Plebeiibacterium sediminum]